MSGPPVLTEEERNAAMEPPSWPLLSNPAWHGLAGEFVAAIEPHTEADPVELLVDFLVSFGNAVGSGPHASADGSRHPARLNVVLVGKTSKAREPPGLRCATYWPKLTSGGVTSA